MTSEEIKYQSELSDTKDEKYELYRVHARVICDALERQINEIEKDLQDYGTVLIDKEKKRLLGCIKTMFEALEPIERILDANKGTITFSSTPKEYYSDQPISETVPEMKEKYGVNSKIEGVKKINLLSLGMI